MKKHPVFVIPRMTPNGADGKFIEDNHLRLRIWFHMIRYRDKETRQVEVQVRRMARIIGCTPKAIRYHLDELIKQGVCFPASLPHSLPHENPDTPGKPQDSFPTSFPTPVPPSNPVKIIPTTEEPPYSPPKGGTPSRPRKERKARFTEEEIERATKVINYLNEKANRSFKPVDANLGLIIQRMREGADGKDFAQVILAVVHRWKDDDRMDQYLRPATLFGPQNFWTKYLGLPVPKDHR